MALSKIINKSVISMRKEKKDFEYYIGQLGKLGHEYGASAGVSPFKDFLLEFFKDNDKRISIIQNDLNTTMDLVNDTSRLFHEERISYEESQSLLVILIPLLEMAKKRQIQKEKSVRKMLQRHTSAASEAVKDVVAASMNDIMNAVRSSFLSLPSSPLSRSSSSSSDTPSDNDDEPTNPNAHIEKQLANPRILGAIADNLNNDRAEFNNSFMHALDAIDRHQTQGLNMATVLNAVAEVINNKDLMDSKETKPPQDLAARLAIAPELLDRIWKYRERLATRRSAGGSDDLKACLAPPITLSKVYCLSAPDELAQTAKGDRIGAVRSDFATCVLSDIYNPLVKGKARTEPAFKEVAEQLLYLQNTHGTWSYIRTSLLYAKSVFEDKPELATQAAGLIAMVSNERIPDWCPASIKTVCESFKSSLTPALKEDSSHSPKI
jgi:hypothetical protein